MEDGCVSVLFGGYDLGAVVEDFIPGDVVFEGSVDQNFTFDIDEDHGTDHF